MKSIGRVVQYHRKRSGLSRLQLAEVAGVGKTLIYDIEHGKETIKFSGLQKVLNTLNIQIALNSPLMDDYHKEQNQREKS